MFTFKPVTENAAAMPSDDDGRTFLPRTMYVDPSPHGTGICVVDQKEHWVDFALINVRTPTMRRYEVWYDYSQKVNTLFRSHLDAFEPRIVKTETPPPVGQTSAGLTGLGFLLLSTMKSHRCGLEGITLINPFFISLFQKKFFSPTTPRNLIAKQIIQRMKEADSAVDVRHEELLEDNDVATAFLFYFFEKLRDGTDRLFTVLPRGF